MGKVAEEDWGVERQSIVSNGDCFVMVRWGLFMVLTCFDKEASQ